ncbi:MAG: phosphatase PAP2 family protein [Thermoanaerobaculia bacterium]
MPYIVFAALFLGFWLVLEHLLPSALSGGQHLMRPAIRWILRIPIFERIRASARGRFASLELYLPVFAVGAAGLIASLFLGDAFFDLAEALHENSPALQEADEIAHEWAVYFHTRSATGFFTALTILGTPVGLGVLVAIVCGIALVRGKPYRALYLAVTAVVGGLLNIALKDLFERARPDLSVALREASGFSFPSGHAMGATIVFGALAYLAYRMTWPWRGRAAAIAGCVTLALGIAASRIYLGVHWISDIAAGIAVGSVWVVVSIVAYETFRRLRALRVQARGPNLPGNGSLPPSDARDGDGAA